jgi:hypothetical protein
MNENQFAKQQNEVDFMKLFDFAWFKDYDRKI